MRSGVLRCVDAPDVHLIYHGRGRGSGERKAGRNSLDPCCRRARRGDHRERHAVPPARAVPERPGTRRSAGRSGLQPGPARQERGDDRARAAQAAPAVRPGPDARLHLLGVPRLAPDDPDRDDRPRRQAGDAPMARPPRVVRVPRRPVRGARARRRRRRGVHPQGVASATVRGQPPRRGRSHPRVDRDDRADAAAVARVSHRPLINDWPASASPVSNALSGLFGPNEATRVSSACSSGRMS